MSRQSTRRATLSEGVILPVVIAVSTLAVAAGVSMVMSPRKNRTRNAPQVPEEETDVKAELAGVLPAVENDEDFEVDHNRAVPQWVDVNLHDPIEEAEYLTTKGEEDDSVWSNHFEESRVTQLGDDSASGAGSISSEQSDESSTEAPDMRTKPTYPASIGGEMWC